MWITTNWKILKEMQIPDHQTCLLRNLYAGQEAIIKTRHGTTDWFQIGKGVCQGGILSPCLFNINRFSIVKMTKLPNTIQRVNVIPFKLPMKFFTELEEKFHNSYGNTKDPK